MPTIKFEFGSNAAKATAVAIEELNKHGLGTNEDQEVWFKITSNDRENGMLVRLRMWLISGGWES